MTDLRKAAEQALELLELVMSHGPAVGKAKEALRQALNVDAVNMTQECVDKTAKGKHKWVGLTELELRMIYCNTSEYRDFWEAYSAKLKEKNG